MSDHHHAIAHDTVTPSVYSNPDIELLLVQLEIETEKAKKLFEDSKQASFVTRYADWGHGLVTALTFVMLLIVWLFQLHKISTMTMVLTLAPTVIGILLGMQILNSNDDRMRKQFRERFPSEAKLLWK